MHVERRIRAAQQLAGFDSLDDLADAINRPGLSRKTLRRIASDNDPRTAKDHELEWIAAACSVPLEFLTSETSDDSGIEARLRAIEENVTARNHHDQIVEALLSRQSEILTRIEALLSALQVQEPAESTGFVVPKVPQSLRDALNPERATQPQAPETRRERGSQGRGA